ncbi:hypothetical protein FRP1_30095 (plasmid) [Pseudonocardia sp. EC080625-04]|nr:hypothetical protein FRP1_30095 [Pseudonocardia sp. EC080625-04]ALL85923.1 hypothetical protein AD017_33060 [Pseudonocardia sp. EC080619-01]
MAGTAPAAANLAVVESIAEHIAIDADGAIRWFGELAVPLPQVADELVAEALESHVADILYSACYIYGTPRPISATRNDIPILSSNAGFVRELIQAYRGGDQWLPSFEHESDTALTLWGVRYLKPELYSAAPDRRLPTALPLRSPGYVLFVGDRGPRSGATPDGATTRVYWNVTRSGAPVLVSHLTEKLNGQQEPFQLKVAHNASLWPERADVAVLYLPAGRLAATWDTIASVHEGIGPDVRPWTPAFTRRVADGLAIADDPPGGLSFGQAMSRILARGIREDHVRNGGRSDRRTRVGHMTAALADSGRGIGSTHLNPGGDEPVLPAVVSRRAPARSPGRDGGSAVRDRQLAERAGAIADLLSDAAVTDGGRCVWLARRADTAGSPALESTGPEFYDGTSGIALFLAHAGTVLQRPRLVETAQAAARGALERLPDLEHHHGLHGGRVGAAATVIAVGRTLGLPGLRDDGVTYLLDAVEPALGDDPLHHDLIYGVAGSVLSYCWAALETDPGPRRRALIGRAESLARPLARHVRCLLDGAADPAVLPGLAHGPSASALALSVLDRMSGGSGRWAAAVTAAADHERRYLDRETRNWPGGPSGVSESRFNWCYGAPGIAIARLLAGDRLEDPESDVAVAVQATTDAAARFLGRAADPSACHGKLSVVGVLDLVRDRTGRQQGDARADQLLDEALDHYGQADVVRLAPGVMAGAAGAGLAALRKCRPGDVRSPLFPLVPSLGKDDT